MNASVPVEIGTRGTIGSLLRKEIEYFTRVDLNINPVGSGSSRKSSQRHSSAETVAPPDNEGNSWRSFSSLVMKWRRKKKRGSGVLPAMCSMVEISHSHRINEMPGFSYRSLRDEFQSSDF